MNDSWIAGWVVEVIGIIPAACVALSYLFTNQRKLRIINTVASLLFVLYGVLLASTSGWQNGWVTAAMNAFCAAIHVVWLVKDFMRRGNSKSKKEPTLNAGIQNSDTEWGKAPGFKNSDKEDDSKESKNDD